MTQRYFRKTSPNTPVQLSTGKAVRFDDLGNNTGFYVTDDDKVVVELETCMKAGRGGISNSTKEEYEDAIKKKRNSPALRASLILEKQTAGLVTITVPSVIPQEEAVVPAAVAAETPAPVLAKPAPGEAPDIKVGKRPKE